MQTSSATPLANFKDGSKCNRRRPNKKTLFRPYHPYHTACCLLLETAPEKAPLYLGRQTLHRLDSLACGLHTDKMEINPDVYQLKTGGCRRYLALFYSEDFRAAYRAGTLSGWSAVLEHYPPRIPYLPLLSTLHTISCCHHYLLLFLLLLYCYFKSKALSIPLGLWQERSQDFGEPDRSSGISDFPLASHIRTSS